MKSYYKPAVSKKSFFGNYSYQLSFPQMQQCLVFQNIFVKIWGFLKYKLCYKKKSRPKTQQELEKQLPLQIPNFQNQSNKIKVTWIGHATVVISIGKNANFIIDPTFSDKRKRYQPAPCKISDLPAINCVLVSHDHYDHLDKPSLKQLEDRFHPTFIAGLNSADVFPQDCNMVQANWTQHFDLIVDEKKYKITFVPACHWSQRTLFDTNKRLWGGFVIQTPNKKKIYYSGDTGYCSIFDQLRREFNGFDLAILPIGAYQPRQKLKHQHIDPHEAVLIHKQIKSKKSLGVHWGTFSYGCQHFSQPRKDLQIAKRQQGLQDDQFITVNHGGSFTIDL